MVVCLTSANIRITRPPRDSVELPVQRQPEGSLADPFSGKLARRILIGPWAENIKKRRRHNKIFVSLGSLSRIFTPLYAVLTRYDLRDYDAAVVFAGTFTKGDIPELIDESAHRDRYTRLTDESGEVRHDRYLPNPPVLLTGEVESRSGGGGNGNQPALCKQKLVIDPGLPRELVGQNSIKRREVGPKNIDWTLGRKY